MNEAGVVATSETVERGLSFDHIVRTDPGTLAGRYLRSFWQPIYHSVDIAPLQAKPLRVMGEGFTLYRGATGIVHLVDRICPHRGMQLSAGVVEGDEIRCFYHGWKFAGDGRCVEQPAEESRFANKIRLKSYPVREYVGLVFAFLGEGEPPEFPLYPEWEAFDGLLETDSYLRKCNYFQNVENALDQSHIAFVHGASAAAFGTVLGRALKPEESDWGITYTYTRQDGETFVVQFGMPNIVNLAALPTDPDIGWQESLFWWVPIDDRSHIQFSLHRVPAKGDAARRIHARREARRKEIDLPHQRLAEEILAGRMNIRDVDPNRCDIVRLQDDVAQVGQHRIANRSLEHTGMGDIGVAMGRRIWNRELLAFAEGRALKAWKRPATMRPSAWGSGAMSLNSESSEASAKVTPQIVDVRPFVEIEEQMTVLGTLML
jgi:5,5'-dehydrodivanillate O-demethylase